MSTLPYRLRLAHLISGMLPLAGAHLIATRIYPWSRALEDGCEYQRLTLTGSLQTANTGDEIGYFFALRGCYDWKVWAIARAVCRRGDTIVEVGANIGTETVGFGDIVGDSGSVYSFEPEPRNLQRLTANIRISGRTNIHTVPLAVADVVGSVEFEIPPGSNSGTGHIVYAHDPGGRGLERIRVNTTTLDEYLGDRVSARMLMIDVEGAERLVLRGGTGWIGRNRPVIILEAHHHRGELLDLLQEMGFHVYAINRLGLGTPETDPVVPQGNWLAIHESEGELARPVERMIRICGLLPPAFGLHPFKRSKT
jgi:FkbM family methyltransferase